MNKLTKDIFEPYSVGSAPLRPYMNQIARQDAYTIATDGHTLIRSLSENTDFNAEEVEDYPDANELMEDMLARDYTPYKIKLPDIKAALDEIPKVDIYKMTECTEYDGEGITHCWSCNHEHECDECHGDGEISTGEVTGQRYSKMEYINVGEQIFSGDLVERIYNTAKQLGKREVVWWALEPGDKYTEPPHLVFVDPVEILVMPRFRDAPMKPDIIHEIKTANN